MDKFVISIFLLIYLDVISKMLNPTYAIILKRFVDIQKLQLEEWKFSKIYILLM